MSEDAAQEAAELDPRWNWCEVTAIGDREPRYIRTTCNHLETVPVHAMVTGQLVAQLCLTCDSRFYAPWVTELDATALPGHGGHRRAVPRQPVDRPQVGRRRPLAAQGHQP